jgi:hypothetical protein
MTIREYTTSEEAFDDPRCPFSEKNPYNDYATLVVPTEGIVAVACPGTFAVTKAKGHMSFFTVDWLIETGTELHNFVEGVRAAVAEAESHGFEIDPQFAGFRKNT